MSVSLHAFAAVAGIKFHLGFISGSLVTALCAHLAVPIDPASTGYPRGRLTQGTSRFRDPGLSLHPPPTSHVTWAGPPDAGRMRIRTGTSRSPRVCSSSPSWVWRDPEFLLCLTWNRNLRLGPAFAGAASHPPLILTLHTLLLGIHLWAWPPPEILSSPLRSGGETAAKQGVHRAPECL